MPFKFTNQEYADIHFVYGFANGNSAEAAREYRRRFPNRRQPHPHVFINIHQRFANDGLNLVHRDRNIINVNIGRNRRNQRILHEFDRDPTTSTRKISRIIGVSRCTISRTLRRDHRHPYHLQPVQGLRPGDEEHRIAFSRWILNSIENDGNFLSHILWTDESCFTRRGVTNLHNQHEWAHENPHAIKPRNFQHEFSVNIWLGVYNNCLFGPYILPQRLNSANFLEFLETESANMWEEIPLNLRMRAWFQLDGCPAHFGRNVRNWLNTHFPEKWIGRGGIVAWPPRSPDLTPLFPLGFY
jgi:Transposase.